MKKANPGLPRIVTYDDPVHGMPPVCDSYGTLIYRYYDEEWRTGVFTCPKCGWLGSRDEMDGPNIFKELTDYGCPACDEMLLIIDHPTYAEVFEAAAQGNEHAKYDVGVMSGEGEYWEDYKRRAEEYNQGLRDMWDRFEGPKILFG